MGHCKLNRNLAKQLGPDLVGQSGSTTRTKEWVCLVVVAGEVTHIFDHASDAQKTALGHVGGTDGYLLRRHSRRSNNDQIGARQHARQTHLHVSSARGHVDEQVVELAPVHIVEKLFNGFGEHQPTPHESSAFVFNEHAGAHHFQHAAAHDAFVGNNLGFF